jgi:hypothetical protein
MHHIAVDTWSIGVLMRDFGEVFRTLADRRRPALPALSVGYGDFAAWQRYQLAQGELDDQLAHWRDRLDGVATVDVPTDRPRPAQRTYADDTVALALPPDVVSALRALTDSTNATLFVALVAAWALTLARSSGTDDVVVGTPVAGRRRAELENSVGFFVNTVPPVSLPVWRRAPGRHRRARGQTIIDLNGRRLAGWTLASLLVQCAWPDRDSRLRAGRGCSFLNPSRADRDGTTTRPEGDPPYRRPRAPASR